MSTPSRPSPLGHYLHPLSPSPGLSALAGAGAWEALFQVPLFCGHCASLKAMLGLEYKEIVDLRSHGQETCG